MPLQAVPIAFRTTTGDPLSKLCLIWLVARSHLCPDADTFVFFDMRDLAAFAQCSEVEAYDAIDRLRSVGEVTRIQEDLDGHDFEVRLKLPINNGPMEDRKRWALTPDQMASIITLCYGECMGCGAYFADGGPFNFDHIIPRSVGGADVERNAQILCATCNGRKRASIGHVDFLEGRD